MVYGEGLRFSPQNPEENVPGRKRKSMSKQIIDTSSEDDKGRQEKAAKSRWRRSARSDRGSYQVPLLADFGREED